MSERNQKRLRRFSTEDSEGADDWTPEDAVRISHQGTSNRYRSVTNSNSNASGRPRRRGSGTSFGATIQRSPSPAGNHRMLRLKVKAPPNKLRKAIRQSPEITATRDSLARSSKNKKTIIESSEEEDDDEDEDVIEDDDVEEEEDEDEEEDDEGDDGDGDGDGEDEEMEDPEEEGDDDEDLGEEEEDGEDINMPDSLPIPPPKIKIFGPAGGSRKVSPGRTIKLTGAKIQSVEEVEMDTPGAEDDDDDEEELSDLDSRDGSQNGDIDEEDGAEADEDNDIINANTVDDSELDSDVDTSTYDSRAGTPDLSKLTRRQRAHFEEQGNGLMALSNEAQKKKFFTAEQITMRRAEMARRRKDLSEKRNEEEKADTLNRLLHKPAPKRRSRLQMQQAAEEDAIGTPRSQEMESRPNPVYLRTVVNADGSKLGIPEEWSGTPSGRVFEGAKTLSLGSKASGWGSGRFIEVVDEPTSHEVESRA